MPSVRCLLVVAAALVLLAAPSAAWAGTAPDSLPATTAAAFLDSTVLTVLRAFPEAKYEVSYRVVEKGRLKHRTVRGRLTVSDGSLVVSHRVFKRLNAAEDRRTEIPLAEVESIHLQRNGTGNLAAAVVTLLIIPLAISGFGLMIAH